MAEAGETVVHLTGLAQEWDNIAEVRTMLRTSGSVVQAPPGKLTASEDVLGVAANKLLMEPVVLKLKLSGSEIGMVAIPNLECEPLGPLSTFLFAAGLDPFPPSTIPLIATCQAEGAVPNCGDHTLPEAVQGGRLVHQEGLCATEEEGAAAAVSA